MHSRTLTLLTSLFLLMLPLTTGCSGDDDDSPTPGGDTSPAPGDDDTSPAGDDDASTSGGDDDATSAGDDDSSTPAGDTPTPAAVSDEDEDGFAAEEDCDDGDASIHPGADEACNETDDDCDGLVDEEVQQLYFIDLDDDGFGSSDSPVAGCSVPVGYTDNSADCDDTLADVNPNAEEVCDGIDNDCDLEIDEESLSVFYADQDEDGFGDDSSTTSACTAPEGTVEEGGDCDDGDGSRYPGALEVCNEVDDDCDGDVDDGAGVDLYPDADADGYGDQAATPIRSCYDPGGYLEDHSDCDDSDADVYPEAPEDGGTGDGLPDGVDNDCDGQIDEGTLDYSIYDIQQSSASGVRVSIRNVVAITGLTGTFEGYESAASVGFFVNEIQGGEYSGILVEIATDAVGELEISEGDLVTIIGTYREIGGYSAIVLDDASDVFHVGSAGLPAAVPIAQACEAADASPYEGVRVSVGELTADTLTADRHGFEYDGCLNVSTALFFAAGAAPTFIQDQPFHSVTGVLYGREELDLEVTDADEIDAALFSYLTPGENVYDAAVAVTFNATDPAASIHYTLDGTTPTEASPSLSPGGSLTIGPGNTTIRYFGVGATETEGTVHEATYRFARAEGAHLLLSEVVVTPSVNEYIELYNPTGEAILLDGYYLTDDASTTGGSATSYEYARVVTGSMYVDTYDFVVAFPAGEYIQPYEVLVVALNNSFSATYGFDPDFELSADSDGIANMVAVSPTKFSESENISLTDKGELVMLFYWDGQSDLVTDVDYVVWNTESTQKAMVDKTDVSLDGPDEDTVSSSYEPDTAPASQHLAATKTHASGASYCRVDMTEGEEVSSGGNGVGGQDETGEDLSVTWMICSKATPGL